MPLKSIRGNTGSGKTLLCVVLLSKFPSIPKYLNFECKLPNCTRMEDTVQLFDLEQRDDDIIVVWDEAYTEMDNRTSMSDRNRINSYLCFQSRKRNMSIVSITQLDIMDVRYRGLEDYFIVAQNRIGRDKDGNDTKNDFVYTISDKIGWSQFVLPYKNAKKYFELYNTGEVIRPHDIDELRQRVEVNTPAKLNALIDKYAVELKAELGDEMPTHDSVKDMMLRHGFIMQYWSYVYVRLKMLQKDQKSTI